MSGMAKGGRSLGSAANPVVNITMQENMKVVSIAKLAIGLNDE